ncbi:MAG: class I SAM-dependent methyltransferase [Spirochaetota bacterium]
MNYPDRLFDAFMYPLEAVSLTSRRRERIAAARGDVLELGAGTGANLEHYDPRSVRSLTLTDLDPNESLRERAEGFRARAREAGDPASESVFVVHADASSLPFAGASFDTVVFTLVFCSVPDQPRALSEVRRVLRPDGRLIFIEHVRPPGPVRHLVDSLNPLWHAITRECNINRETVAAIESAGFDLSEVRVSGGGFLADGIARPRVR